MAAERDLKSKLSRMFDNKSIYIRRIDNKTSSDAVVPDKVQACEEQSVDMELPLCCIDDDDNDNDAMEVLVRCWIPGQCEIELCRCSTLRRQGLMVQFGEAIG